MPLKVGLPLPEITLKQKTDAGLVDVSLRRNVGKGKTIILFVPLAFTGTCTDELCKVSGLLDEYKKLGYNNKLDGTNLSQILGYMSIDMLTNVENNIKMHY